MSYTKINDLLSVRKTESERFKELCDLIPSFLDGKKVYYQQNFYVRYDVNTKTVYSGSDRYLNHETKVNSAFPYIFYIAGVNGAKAFAQIYSESEELKADKSFSLDENGFVVLKDYGVVSQDPMIRNILEPEETQTKTVEESIVDKNLEIIEDEITLELNETPKKASKKKEPKEKKTKEKSSKTKKTTKKKTA